MSLSCKIQVRRAVRAERAVFGAPGLMLLPGLQIGLSERFLVSEVARLPRGVELRRTVGACLRAHLHLRFLIAAPAVLRVDDALLAENRGAYQGAHLRLITRAVKPVPSGGGYKATWLLCSKLRKIAVSYRT